MSRTIRRKGPLPDWCYDKHYSCKSDVKVTRTYTRWDWGKKEKYEETYSFYPVYWIKLPKREWVPEERSKWRYHSDAWRDHNCGKWGQRVWHKKIRQYDRQEMHRFLVEEEYEPLWFTTKIDTWWWD